MRQTFPVALEAEFRGRAEGGEFVREETGEKVVYGSMLKFEMDHPENPEDVAVLEFRVGNAMTMGVPIEQLKRGERYSIEGYCVLNNAPGSRSYFKPLAVRPRAQAGALKAA